MDAKQNHSTGAASSSSVPSSSIEVSVSRIKSSSLFDQSGGQQQQLESTATNYDKPSYDQLMLAMQELQRQLDAKESEIRSLKAENEELKCDLKEMRGDSDERQQLLQIEDVGDKGKEAAKDQDEKEEKLSGDVLQLKYEKEIENEDKDGDCEMMIINGGVDAAPQDVNNGSQQQEFQGQEKEQAAGQDNGDGNDEGMVIQDDHEPVNNNNNNNGQSKEKVKQDEKEDDAEEENDWSPTNIPKFPDIDEFKIANSEQAKKLGKSTLALACNICGKWQIPIPKIKPFGSFSTSGSLKRHFKRTHWANAPFKCGVCSFVGLTKKHLKAHKKRHRRPEPYPDDDFSYSPIVSPDFQRPSSPDDFEYFHNSPENE